MILKCTSWEQRVQVEALRFGEEVWRSFERCLLASCREMPENSGAMRAVALNTYVDALVSSVAVVAASYDAGGPSGQLEEVILSSLRQKFTELRMRRLGDKGEQERVEKETEH